MASQSEVDSMVGALQLDGADVSSKVEGRCFIGGEYVDAECGEWIESINPSTGKVVARVASGQKEDVEKAVKAARGAADAWANTAPADRRAILLKFANLIEENLVELAVMDTVEAGKPISDNLEGDVPGTVECFKYHAEAVNKLYDQIAPTGPDNLGLIVREPVGVVGLVVPWNFPLLMAAWKLAPALATGNCCILKPSEMTSLSSIRLGALANEAGIPAGVLNIVPGYGTTVGAAIGAHMDIDMVGFTGSTAVGRLVLEAAAKSNMKRVSLECGGKSPQLVFDDAEEFLDKVVDEVMNAAFWNQAENCSCGSRLLVQKGIKPKLMAKLIAAANSSEWKVGDPQKLETKCGSMISKQHCEKVLGYIAKGKAEGAVLVAGGGRIHAESGGDFVSLTIFDHVTNDMAIAQEEIFGPCLSVIEFDDEEQAISIANDTVYGLAASLYTPNIHRVHRVSRALKAGNVSVNCFGEGDDSTPFGGYRQSGFVGRDKSIMAHDQYQEIKTIWMEMYPK